MKFFACILVCVCLAVVFYAVISFIRFSFVRMKAYIIRRKLGKLVETETKTETKKND